MTAASCLRWYPRLRCRHVHECVQVTRRGGIERTYNLDQNIQICGPFGSSFSRCFNMHRQRGQHERSAYDIVILYGSGLGVPSALAALSEYFERRRDGTQVPQFVHFLWQARAFADRDAASAPAREERASPPPHQDGDGCTGTGGGRRASHRTCCSVGTAFIDSSSK
jgi:hypothetical protein